MAKKDWYGAQRDGWYTYKEAEQKRVVALLHKHCTGPNNEMKTQDFYELCKPISPRAVQQILSDRDGKDYLLARYPGLFLCTEANQGNATSERLRTRAQTEMDRLRRREQFGRRLP